MKKMSVIYIVGALVLVWLLSGFLKFEGQPYGINAADSTFPLPSNFPAPVYNFSKNRFTKIKIELGRRLFYDGTLSKNGTVSCGTCHIQASAFSHHGHRLSHGIFDSLGARNAPALQNLAWATSFMWDGGVNNLDLQPLVPITSHVEMGESVESVTEKLQKDPYYPTYFAAAFGSRQITTARVMQALSQFMSAMVSANSKYDKVIRNEGAVFTNEEAKGYTLFKAKCASCHQEPFFTDFSFRNNGLSIYSEDKGRMGITSLDSDKNKFKVPSLRNIFLTAPYMHDGRFKDIDNVLEHYTAGVQLTENIDPLLLQASGRAGIALTLPERQAVKSFLQTLTDSAFISNRGLSEVNICPQCIRY